MANITKKQMEKFNKNVEKLLLLNGFVNIENVDSLKQFLLNTEKLGKINILLDFQSSSVYSVFCRIENVNEGIKHFPKINQWSGKYNFHEIDYDSIISNLYYFISKVKEVNNIKINA